MADLGVQALEARSRHVFDKLEEKVKRQCLRARLLEAEHLCFAKKMARKSGRELSRRRRLDDATNSRLKVEEQANMLARTEEEVRKMDAIVSKLKDRVPVLTTELEKTLAGRARAVARAGQPDAEWKTNRPAGHPAREARGRRTLWRRSFMSSGLQVASLTEHVEDSSKVTAARLPRSSRV